jgi:peroxiredoxin
VMKNNSVINSTLFFLIATFLFACKSNEKESALLTGELQNADHIKVYFERIDGYKEVMLDSTITDGSGKFSLRNLADGLDYYILRTGNASIAYLILQGGEALHITGNAQNLTQTYSVEGSPDTKILIELRKFESNISDSLNNLYTTSRETDPLKKDSAGMILQHQYEITLRSFATDFIKRNPVSIVSLSASQYLDKEKDTAIFSQLSKTLSEKYPANIYVNEFSKQVSRMHSLPAGSFAPEIKLKTPDGKEISLSSFRGKIVLVDFWASWCAPCRKENPNIVAMYKKFHPRGFEILGVSLDDNLNSWKDAIEHDRLSWTQVSELKKWESEVVKDYGMEEIPFSVLIDREGKIIAKGLHGSELEVKIEEALAN